MFLGTQKDETTNLIKIGNNVPKDAVNLAYYKNPTLNDNGGNVSLSTPPQSDAQTKEVTKIVYKNCIAVKDNSSFDEIIHYEDNDGYEGDLYIYDNEGNYNIKWYEHEHNFDKLVKQTKTIEHLGSKEIPDECKSMYYEEPHESGIMLTGTLYAINVDYKPAKTEKRKIKNIEKKFVRCTKRSKNQSDINDFYNYSQDGFSGTLNLIKDSKRAINNLSPSYCDFRIKYTNSISENGIDENGIHYSYFKEFSTNEKRTIKTLGWCRYWSYDNENYWYDRHSYSSPPRKPTDNYYLPNHINNYNILPGTWNDDEDMASSFVAPNVENRTKNWAWVSVKSLEDLKKFIQDNYFKDKDNKNSLDIPDMLNSLAEQTGLSSDNYGRDRKGNTFKTLNFCENCNDYKSLNYKTLYENIFIDKKNENYVSGPLDTETTSNVLNNRGVINSKYEVYFKDCIGFFKAEVEVINSCYIYQSFNNGNADTTYEADYEGYVYKETEEEIDFPIEYSALITYQGIIRGSYIDYNGVATYTGKITRKVNICTNGNSNNYIYMYPFEFDNKYYLFKDIATQSSRFISGELLRVTNIFKDNVPLFYRYRTKHLFYTADNVDDFMFYTGSLVKVTKDNFNSLDEDEKVKFKLTKTNTKNVYYLDIYTSFIVTSTNRYYVTYNKYDSASIEVTTEEIFVQPFMINGYDYFYEEYNSKERKNLIYVKDPLIIQDTRNLISFNYKIQALKDNKVIKTSTEISAIGVNYEYAICQEKNKFIDNRYIISPKSDFGYQTAKDIVGDIKEENITYRAILSSDNIYRNYINLYTSPDGNSVVSVEILTPTGIEDNKGEYTKKLSVPENSYLYKGNIYECYAVNEIDNRQIELKNPRETELLKDWNIELLYGYDIQELSYKNVNKKYIYTLPEYNTQDFSSLGKPYVTINKEECKYINSNTIKLKNYPLFVLLDKDKITPTNLNIYTIDSTGNKKYYTISNWIFNQGFVFINEIINVNDKIYADYTYEENNYIYRGYYNDLNDLIRLDTNTNIYHRYTNEKLNFEDNCKNLFNKISYFFLKPSCVINDYGEGEPLRKKKLITISKINTDNNFADQISITDNEYSGNISKSGDSEIIGTSSSTESYTFNSYLDNTTNSFPETMDINSNGFVGKINKFENPFVVNGNDDITDTRNISKTVVKTTNYFEKQLNYNENGYIGILSKNGSVKTIGKNEPEDSKDITITQYYTNKTDIKSHIAYSENNYSGTLYDIKEEGLNPIYNYDYSTNSKLKRYEDTNIYTEKDLVPKTYYYSEDGYYASIPLVSTIEYCLSYTRPTEYISNLFYNSENGIPGSIIIPNEKDKDNNEVSGKLIRKNVSYIESTVQSHTVDNPGNIPYSESYLPAGVTGFYLKNNNSDETNVSLVINIYCTYTNGEMVFTHGEVNTCSAGIDGNLYFNNVISGETINNGKENISLGCTHRYVMLKEYYTDYASGYNGSMNLVEGQSYLTSIQFCKTCIDYPSYSNYTPQYNGVYLYDKYFNTSDGYNADTDTIIDANYSGIYEGTIYKSIQTVDKNNPIYQYYKVTYSGTVTKPEINTLKYVQEYSGTISKTITAQKTYRQLYKGTLQKNIDQVNQYRQLYSGYIYKTVGVVNTIEIVFVVNVNKNMNKYNSNLRKNIYDLYTSLKNSEITVINMGLCIYNSTNNLYYDASFTDDINEILSTIDELTETNDFINSTSNDNNLIKALNSTIDGFNFISQNKNIIVYSSEKIDDNSLVYDVLNKAQEQNIKIYTITDTNAYYSTSYTLLTNDTGGYPIDINYNYNETIIDKIGTSCGINKILICNSDCLYHLIDDDKQLNANDIYIGSAFFKHYTSYTSTKVLDARTRGGGILESLKDNIRKELEPESDYYFDIGYYDGEPYFENRVIIIRLDKNILNKFTTNEIEAAINKHLAYGTIPLIEYVNIEENLITKNDIIVEQKNENNFDYKPSFTAFIKEQ